MAHPPTFSFSLLSSFSLAALKTLFDLFLAFGLTALGDEEDNAMDVDSADDTPAKGKAANQKNTAKPRLILCFDLLADRSLPPFTLLLLLIFPQLAYT